MTNPNVRPDLEALKVLAQRVTSDAPKAEIGSAVFNKWHTETMQAELDVFAALPDLIAHIERLQQALELVRMSFGWGALSDETKAVIDAALTKGSER